MLKRREKYICVGIRKKDEVDRGWGGVVGKKIADGAESDGRSLLARVAVHACGDCGEGDRIEAFAGGDGEGGRVAGSKEFGFAVGAAMPDGAHCMNDALYAKVARAGGHRVAGRQAVFEGGGAQGAAVGQNRGAAGAVYGAIDTATA